MDWIYTLYLFLVGCLDVSSAIVDCGPATFSLDTDKPCTAVGGSQSGDTKEGDWVKFTCTDLLWRTKSAIDYCPVELCESNGKWRTAQLSCGSSECYNLTSQSFMGRRICTTSGYMCQSWDSQTPHTHPYTDFNLFPDLNITKAGSYCRDPGGVKGYPWCYTTNQGVEFESCGILDCNHVDTKIGQGQCPDDYCGDPHPNVAADNNCLDVSLSTFTHNVDSTITYTCQSLLLGHSSTARYCPVRRCKSDDFYWTDAVLTCGVNECYTSGSSDQYQGYRECTDGGWTCQRWDSQSPHTHTYTSASLFPDTTVSAADNYCRDPGGVRGAPWCYTTNASIEWQFCKTGMPICGDLPINSGTCSPTVVPTLVVTTTPTPPPTLVTTSTPTPTIFIEQRINGTMYHRQGSVLTGFTKQSPLENNLDSAVTCAKTCSSNDPCVMITYDNSGTCSLYDEDISNSDSIDCSSQKCYVKD